MTGTRCSSASWKAARRRTRPDLAGSVDGAAAVFVAGELGQDLADAFGDKDVFILQ